jgi:hypothetical protein
VRREQREHLLRSAGTVVRDTEIMVIGSQSILGSFDEKDLPRGVTLSFEADFLPFNDPDQSKADLIDGVLVEDSMFHETHHVYAQGVDATTAVLPDGWRKRLVRLDNENTNGVTGWCLDRVDLCVSKLVAFRPKDLLFVSELLDANIVRRADISQRPAETSCSSTQSSNVASFLSRGHEVSGGLSL